ncbi:MAG: PAS domain S-box protein, partial [Thermomicrobiales bacterium]|nr:PAS domain S-box protein [Thermomicrobiales bacterium]
MLVEAADRPVHAARCEMRIRHADGSWRWMAVVATNRLADPAVRGIICNLRDITERHEAALAEASLCAREIAARDLHQIAAAKSDFLRLLGHEFKTPLTVIAGFAELIELELPGNENVLESTRVIRDEARRLVALIDDLLLLDQMEATPADPAARVGRSQRARYGKRGTAERDRDSAPGACRTRARSAAHRRRSGAGGPGDPQPRWERDHVFPRRGGHHRDHPRWRLGRPERRRRRDRHPGRR